MSSRGFLCIGTHEEMARHLLDCRARWGISYFSVRDIEGFAPLIELVRRLDGHAHRLEELAQGGHLPQRGPGRRAGPARKAEG